jgi:hypothetical protein
MIPAHSDSIRLATYAEVNCAFPVKVKSAIKVTPKIDIPAGGTKD